MKNPLLIDNRIDNFNLTENEVVMINPKTINLVETRKAKLSIVYNEGEENEETKEIDGFNTIVYTTESPRDRFNFFTTHLDSQWLKNNAERIGLSKVIDNEEEGNFVFINKENIIDLRYKRKVEKNKNIEKNESQSELEEVKENGEVEEKEETIEDKVSDKEIRLILFFKSPKSENSESKDPYDDLLSYAMNFNLDEEAKEMEEKGIELRPYTIINNFLNKF